VTLAKYFDPKHYVRRLRRIQALKNYDLLHIEAEEIAKFHAIGLDPVAALPHLNSALRSIGSEPYDDLTGTDSIHWLVFAALSLSPRADAIRDILEIGTFRGKTTLLLKTMFPDAQVTTVDLPTSDPIMQQTYRRDTPEQLAEYRATRDSRVNREGIAFIETNSFFIPGVAKGPFDLIWMDGGHLFPEVAWDFCNSWHACRSGGILMCDDIIPDPRGSDSYASDESHKVISYVAARTDIAPVYLLKRRNPNWSADPVTRKFVAVLQRP
jgi:predicted O-methyltransferase YrrM